MIVADPEWRFEPWSRHTGLDRAADNHYSTSCTEVIAARDVQSIAADDCVLFLWATGPMLPHALRVMAEWGFDYKSHYAWGKDKVGTGYWCRERHELLLIGTCGSPVCPAPGTQWDSLIMSPRLAHSQKPECFLEDDRGLLPQHSKDRTERAQSAGKLGPLGPGSGNNGGGGRMRQALPQRRAAETFNIRFWNQPFTVTVGFYADGTPGEVFIDGPKTGQDIQSIARDAAVILSLALQHGVPLATIRRASTRGTHGEAASILGAIVDCLTVEATGSRAGPSECEPRHDR